MVVEPFTCNIFITNKTSGVITYATQDPQQWGETRILIDTVPVSHNGEHEDIHLIKATGTDDIRLTNASVTFNITDSQQLVFSWSVPSGAWSYPRGTQNPTIPYFYAFLQGFQAYGYSVDVYNCNINMCQAILNEGDYPGIKAYVTVNSLG